jgi:hypothetical protein
MLERFGREDDRRRLVGETGGALSAYREVLERRKSRFGCLWKTGWLELHESGTYVRLLAAGQDIRNRAMIARFAVALAVSFELAERPRHHPPGAQAGAVSPRPAEEPLRE